VFSKILVIIFLFTGFVYADEMQASRAEKRDSSEIFTPNKFKVERETYWEDLLEHNTFTSEGSILGKSYRDSRQPFEVIDTIRVTDNIGMLKLNKVSSKGKKSIIPSKSNRLSVVITARDALNDNLSWGWDYVNFKDNAEIQIYNSGDSSFTGLVDVHIKVR